MTQNEIIWLARLLHWLTKKGYTSEEIDSLLQYIANETNTGEK